METPITNWHKPRLTTLYGVINFSHFLVSLKPFLVWLGVPSRFVIPNLIFWWAKVECPSIQKWSLLAFRNANLDLHATLLLLTYGGKTPHLKPPTCCLPLLFPRPIQAKSLILNPAEKAVWMDHFWWVKNLWISSPIHPNSTLSRPLSTSTFPFQSPQSKPNKMKNIVVNKVRNFPLGKLFISHHHSKKRRKQEVKWIAKWRLNLREVISPIKGMADALRSTNELLK